MKTLANPSIAAAVLAFLAGCAPESQSETPKPIIATTVSTSWGSGAGQLGRNVASEAESRGPSSFVVDASSTVHVLDQVNARIQKFSHGAPAGDLSIPERPFTDIELDGKGGYVLLDRYQAPALVFLDAQGKITTELPLPQDEIPNPSQVTTLTRYSDGYYVLVEGEYLVRVADAAHAAVEPSLVPGQALSGSIAIKADVAQGQNLTLHRIPAPGTPPSTLAQLSLDGRTGAVTLLAPAPNAGIFLGVRTFATSGTQHTLFVLDASGHTTRTIALPEAASDTVDVSRRARLGEDGKIYVLSPTDSGIAIEEVSP